jgi:hypothetical protein
LGNFCAANEAGIVTEAAAARMDRIIAADGLTVTMEAMLNHPVLKKDELSVPTKVAPDEVIQYGLNLLLRLTDDAAQGCKERRRTLRKTGVLGVLPPVVAAFTEAEIDAGMHPDAEVQNNKVKAAYLVAKALVGTDRLDACMEGFQELPETSQSDHLSGTVGSRRAWRRGTEGEPGFCCELQLLSFAARPAARLTGV